MIFLEGGPMTVFALGPKTPKSATDPRNNDLGFGCVFAYPTFIIISTFTVNHLNECF